MFGIPPELLGILNNSNRATIESADYLFSRWVVTPRLEFLRSQLQERLIPEYDDRLVLDFVSPVEEDRAHMLEAAKAAPWAMKVDEWRTLQGQETLNDESGQVHMMPVNLIPVRSPSVPPAPVPATVAGETPPEGDVIADGWDDHLAVLKDANDSADLAVVRRELATDESDLPEVWQELARQEPAVERLTRRHILELSDRVTADQLAHVTTGVEIERLIHLDEWLHEMNSLMQPQWMRAWWTGADHTASDLGLPIKRRARSITKQDAEEDDPESPFYFNPDLLDIPLPGISPTDLDWDFNDLNPAAINWANIHGGQYIQQIGDDTRNAIQASLVDALAMGLSVDEEARELLKLQIGLTTQQRTAVWHFRQRLMSQMPHLTPEERIARIKRYRDTKVKLRAMTIARTELAFASAGGQEDIWADAVKQQMINVSEMKRKWIATIDGRTCPVCRNLGNMEPIPFEKSFASGKFVGQNAPAHPNCRCTVGLIRTVIGQAELETAIGLLAEQEEDF